MAPQISADDTQSRRTALLLEAVDLLVSELAALSGQQWEKVPELKKKKVILASRLRELKAMADLPEDEPVGLERLVDELEDQSQRTIRAQIDLIGQQILALQELHLFWLECLHLSLRVFTGKKLSPDLPSI